MTSEIIVSPQVSIFYSETLRERTAQAHFLAIAEFSLFPNDEFTKGNKGK